MKCKTIFKWYYHTVVIHMLFWICIGKYQHNCIGSIQISGLGPLFVGSFQQVLTVGVPYKHSVWTVSRAETIKCRSMISWSAEKSLLFFHNWLIVLVIFSNINCFHLLICEDFFLLFCVFFFSKQVIWVHNILFKETVIGIFHYFQTFYRPYD